MPANAAFWDTSAIIPLFCNQVKSPELRRLRRRFSELVIWWGTPVEVYSGIWRLRHEGVLTQAQSKTSLERWERVYSVSRVVPPDDRILRIAVLQISRHRLRAGDAFQLAAALIWCNERPRKRPFVTADRRLGEAAVAAGFELVFVA
jgi:predicted nucleic acid-binding protein